MFRFLIRALTIGFAVLPACDEGAVEPVFEGEIMAVLAGRVTSPDGAPVVEALVTISLPCAPRSSSCTTSGGALTDETGRFVRWFRQDGHPYTATAEVIAKPATGQGYDLGMVVREVEARFQPVPPADTTFVELELPPNESDSRRPIWVQEISFRALPGPLLADADYVYVSSPGGIAAFNGETGEYLWAEDASLGLAGFPFDVVGGVVVVGREDILNGRRSSNGGLLWTRQGVPNRGLTTAEPDLLFASDGDSIAAYDPQTGDTRWTRALPTQGRATIESTEDVVCAGQAIVGGILIACWRISDGLSLWSRPFERALWLAVVGDRVVVPAGESQGESGWTGVDARTGTTLWRSALPSTGPPAISRDTGNIYSCTQGGASECLAVQVEDGVAVWRKSLDEEVNPPATGGGNVSVVPRSDSGPASLLVLDADSGELRERIDPDPLDDFGFCATPAVSGEMVFVFGCYGYIYAFRVGL